MDCCSGLSNRDVDNLLDAACYGDIKKIEYLKFKPDEYSVPKKPKFSSSLYKTDLDGHTALHIAASYGHTDICECLIEEFGFDVNVRDPRDATPLHLVVSNGHEETAFYLLKAGADLNAVTNVRKTVLHLAAEAGSTRLMEYFIANGLGVDVRSDYGVPLQVAALACRRESIDFLLKNKADPNQIPPNTHSPLVAAIYGGSYECVKMLLEAGVDPNMESFFISPLQAAVADNQFEMVELLLKKQANPNVENIYGVTSLLVAYCSKHTQIEALLYKNAFHKDEELWRYLELRGSIGLDKQLDIKFKEAKELYISKAGAAEICVHSMLWYSLVVDLDLGDTFLYSNLSLCHAKLKDGHNALKDALAFEKLKPLHPEAHYRKGVAFDILQLFDTAVDCFEQALLLWESCEEEVLNVEKYVVEEALRDVHKKQLECSLYETYP